MFPIKLLCTPGALVPKQRQRLGEAWQHVSDLTQFEPPAYQSLTLFEVKGSRKNTDVFFSGEVEKTSSVKLGVERRKMGVGGWGVWGGSAAAQRNLSGWRLKLAEGKVAL